MHTKSHHSIGDIYLTIAEEILKTPLGNDFPPAEEKMPKPSDSSQVGWKSALTFGVSTFTATEKGNSSGQAGSPGI
jgi:hypothetical protein